MSNEQSVSSTDVKPYRKEVPKSGKKKRKRQRSPAFKWTLIGLQIAFVGYAALLIALALLETRLVYPGAYFADDVSPPLASSAVIETVHYPSTDGLKLAGRLMIQPDSDRYVIYFHGNAEKAMWLDGWLMQLSKAFGATTLIAEYRGFADDQTPTEKGVVADCLASRDYLCDRFGIQPTEIILYGRSLGGGCAVAVASQGGAKALVLERTFDRAVDVAAAKYPFVPVGWLMKNRYDSIAKMTVYRGPLVMLHGGADDVIPIENAERLFKRASGPKQWIPVESMDHYEAVSQQSLDQIVAEVDRLTANVAEPK